MKGSSRLPWRTLAGQCAYGVLFAVVLPAFLVLWARRLDGWVELPLPSGGVPAWGLLALGTVGMSWGALALLVRGGGLPMSPFPPKRLVTRGIYGLIAHPIYLGAVLVSFGISLLAGSPSGFWIVSPVLAASAAAWVVGYEREVTLRHFGALPAPVLRLPEARPDPPGWKDALSVVVLVLVPWLVLYLGVELLGVLPGSRSAVGPWDAQIPVLPWTEAVYVLVYPAVGLAPFFARRKQDLRRFAIRGLAATAGIILFYLLVPVVATAKPIPGQGFWQDLMQRERSYDSPATAFPAFHVVWIFLAAALVASERPRLAPAFWLGAVLATASCVTTGMHAVADVVAGFAAFLLVVKGGVIWAGLRAGAEWVANSWKEIRFGPVRLLSHGIYAAVGAGMGFVLAAWLAGPENVYWVVSMVVASEVGAALWAQFVEGSPQLLRPYGYFGSALAVLLVAVVAELADASGWLVLASVGVGGGVTQAIGRLRCLVQGCCHGREASEQVGIRYNHPRSRVLRLSNLGGIPLHPTPVYSALWSLLVSAILLRLWTLGVPLSFLVGAYYILVGLGRFVEEHFRGEPQTAVLGGLRLYQWLSIGFVAGGIAITMLPAPPAPMPVPVSGGLVWIAILLALGTYLAYGADFPASNRRFSRLV